jgi:N-terminal domain on NACHT_NTPase and P-loop NTPases
MRNLQNSHFISKIARSARFPSSSNCRQHSSLLYEILTAVFVMAEALTVIGLASSIVTFVDVSTKVLERLREFHSIAKETPRVFRHITIQLPLLIDIMRRIEKERTEGSFSADAQCALSHVVEGSLSQITMLDGLIKKILPASTDSTLRRSWKAIASVRKEKDVAVILRHLEAYKSTLTLHFSQRSEEVYIGKTYELDAHLPLN